MADTDVALEVLIKSVCDATGYRMNEVEAQKLKTTIGQLTQVSTASAAEDVAGTDKMILKKRELMHIVNALGGQAVPELARSLSLLAYGGGTAAAIFALVGIFELVRKHIEAVKKAGAEVIELKWETIHQSLDEARQSADDFEDALMKAWKPADAIKTAFEAAKALLEAQIDDHKKLLDAFEKEELAAAKGDKDKEESIRARYEGIKREYDLQAEAAKIDQLTLDIATRTTEQFKLRHVFYQALKAVSSAEQDPALIAAQQALKGKDRTALIEANGGEKYGADVDARLAALGKDTSLSFDQAFRQRQKLEAEKALKEFDENTQVVADHTETIRRLKRKVDEADEAAVANTTTIKEETAQRNSAIPVFREHQRAAQDQAAISKVTAAGGVDAALAGGVGAIDALIHGQKLDQKGQQAYQAFRAVFDSVHANLDRVIALDEQNAGLHQSHDQRISELETMYKNLLSRVNRPN